MNNGNDDNCQSVYVCTPFFACPALLLVIEVETIDMLHFIFWFI